MVEYSNTTPTLLYYTDFRKHINNQVVFTGQLTVGDDCGSGGWDPTLELPFLGSVIK